MNKKTIDVKTFAKMYGFGINRSYELVKQEGFPCFHCGKRTLIFVDQLDEWFKENKGGRC